VIAVASSAAKKLIEPPMICAAAFRRAFLAADEHGGRAVGVIGAGSIGRAIIDGIVESGRAVNVFDLDSSLVPRDRSVRVCQTATDLLRDSEVLWGCSGSDFFRDLPIALAAGGAKTLISCSSSDREFRSVLQRLNGQERFDPLSRLSDVKFDCDGVVFDVRRGGFPVNFDGSSESVPACDIQVTRGLLFAGVLQASSQQLADAVAVMLSPSAQRAVVSEWFTNQPQAAARYDARIAEGFRDDEWIAGQSGGKRLVAAM
jgi:hypothetical protein